MRERVLKILELEKLSNTEFAKKTAILKSNLSHVTNGRSKPSIKFIQKLLNALPYINANWLITGVGEMYLYPPDSQSDKEDENNTINFAENNLKSEKKLQQDNCNKDKKEDSNKENLQESNSIDDNSKIVDNSTTTNDTKNHITTNLGNPEQILVLFDDATFTTYKKRN